MQSYGAVQEGDHIYIAPAAKFLIIASVTGENSGTLIDPCPADCAVTDADLHIIFKTASLTLQGRTALLIERMAKGCLASLAELSPKEGQIFRGTSVEGQLEAVDNTADNVIETDTRKFMTDKDRQSIANIDKCVSDLTLGQIKETDDAKIMTSGERSKFAGINGLEQAVWNAGKGTTEAIVSPAKLFAAIAAMGTWRGGQKFGTDSAGGYILPNGLIFQFGLIGRSESDYRMAFPMAFPNACMFATGVNAYDYGNMGGAMAIVISVSSLARDAVDFRARSITNGGTVIGCVSVPIYWLAIGY